ncbi:MAG: flap endonuclease [Dehalococcoidia bacterium]|nr:flap endonuclease [Dehalococcoidia bacterium]
MNLYLIDGTYELFRAHFGAPPRSAPDGRPIGAVTGLVQSLLLLLREERPDFIACAFDHVVESFRNDLFDGYKTGDGVPEDLFAQFSLAETATRSLGITVWPMVEFEADDAIASAAAKWKDAPNLEKIVICSVDKDLMNLVDSSRVVLWDRRRNLTYTEAQVVERFGVSPHSIPDYLALVGDSADGIPGVPRWGAKSTATVLSEYGRMENIPESYDDWTMTVRGGKTLAQNLSANRENALLYKTLATLRVDAPVSESLQAVRWEGVPHREYLDLCDDLGLERLKDLPHRWQ